MEMDTSVRSALVVGLSQPQIPMENIHFQRRGAHLAGSPSYVCPRKRKSRSTVILFPQEGREVQDQSPQRLQIQMRLFNAHTALHVCHLHLRHFLHPIPLLGRNSG